jgi:hypothetical protein
MSRDTSGSDRTSEHDSEITCSHKIVKGIPIRLLLFVAFSCSLAGAATLREEAEKLAALIDPAKLSTLRERGTNPRIHKAVALLETADANRIKPKAVCEAAIKKVNMNAAAGELTKAALLRNLDIARKLGCIHAAGLKDMRRGRAPTIQRGPYAGDELSVDHIIPRTVVPELDNVIANLEVLPLKLNQKKNSKVGERQTALAEKLHAAGLLSADGLEKVKRAAVKR